MLRKPRISFITTWQTNIGDDFVREGIRAVLDSLCDYHAYIIDKHHPDQSCTSHLAGDYGPQTADKILHANAIVQCGAPVYWNLGEAPGHKCATAEWVRPLWYDRVSVVYQQAPVLNLAAGACQGYYGDASQITSDPECADFMRQIHAFSRLTTVRDKMAAQANETLGLPVILQPCASIHAWRRHAAPRMNRRGIALNFMPIAGHYDIEQRIDPAKWASEFVDIDRRLREAGETTVLVAHDQTELAAMEAMLPGRDVFYSPDFRDYFVMYARCRGGVVNRVHAAMLLAGIGTPVIVVGNDSRTRMVDELGLTRFHVSEASAAHISTLILEQCRDAAAAPRLRAATDRAFNELRELCRDALAGVL